MCTGLYANTTQFCGRNLVFSAGIRFLESLPRNGGLINIWGVTRCRSEQVFLYHVDYEVELGLCVCVCVCVCVRI